MAIALWFSLPVPADVLWMKGDEQSLSLEAVRGLYSEGWSEGQRYLQGRTWSWDKGLPFFFFFKASLWEFYSFSSQCGQDNSQFLQIVRGSFWSWAEWARPNIFGVVKGDPLATNTLEYGAIKEEKNYARRPKKKGSLPLSYTHVAT